MFVVSFVLSFIFVFLLLTIMVIVKALEVKGDGNLSFFECGFESVGLTRRSFSFRFFLIAILFIVFDAEIILMLPVPYLEMGGEGGVIFFFFLWLLLLGLLYEMMFGALIWVD